MTHPSPAGDRRAHLLSNAIYYRDVSNEKN